MKAKIFNRFSGLPLGEYRRMVALVYLIWAGIFLSIAFGLYALSIGAKVKVAPSTPMTIIGLLFIFITSYLLLLKSKYEIASNLFATGALLVLIFNSFLDIRLGASWDIIFFGKTIYIFMILMLSLLFSNRLFIFINFFLTIITVLFYYFLFISNVSPDVKPIILRTIINYMFYLIVIFLIVYYSYRNYNIVVANLEEEKREQEVQKNELATVLKKLQGVIESLNIANIQLVELAKNLSSRVSQQAALSEEISSSTEEISASLQNTAEFVKFTYETTLKVDEEVKHSGENLGQVFDILSQIAEKIGLISEIAEKTDILAINAAIEAAHAGESGRGFAVVAQEIRKLADVSKGFAEEITNFVNHSISISQDTDKRYNSIIKQVSYITDKVGNIKTAIEELAQTVSVINSSAIHLSQSAEENASVAELLVNQADSLKQLAEKLKQNEDV